MQIPVPSKGLPNFFTGSLTAGKNYHLETTPDPRVAPDAWRLQQAFVATSDTMILAVPLGDLGCFRLQRMPAGEQTAPADDPEVDLRIGVQVRGNRGHILTFNISSSLSEFGMLNVKM